MGRALGGAALFGVGDPVVTFSGPSRDDFVRSAERTIADLNQCATFAALGLTEVRTVELINNSKTIGDYLAVIRLFRVEGVVRVGASVAG